MKWYDYVYIIISSLIVVIIATPVLWFEAVKQILKGAYQEQRRENWKS